jgi:hypothetical protein
MFLLGILLIVFIPNMWSLQLGAIRQGLAASFIYWGFYFFKKFGIKLYLTIFLSGLIHVGGLLVLAVVLANALIKRVLPNAKSISRVGIVAVSFPLVIVFIDLVLPYVQSKHSGYVDSLINVGGGLFVFYFLITIMVFIKNKYRVNWTEFEFFGFVGVVTYLTMYFLTPMSGRWLDFFVLPFIIILISRFSIRNLMLTIILLCVNMFLFFNGGAMNVMNKPLW